MNKTTKLNKDEILKLVLPAIDGPKPWSDQPILNDPNRFHIAIMTDRTGGHRPGIWMKAVEQLNLLLPVVNDCGDHCPGPPGLNQQPVIPDAKPKGVDPRWQALQQLQQQMKQP